MSDITPYEHDSTYSIVPSAASLAEQIARSDFAPTGLRGKPEAVMAAMLQGHELGIGPMSALAEISVINGKPCISAKLMRALVHRAGHDLWFEVKSNTKVTICARRADWPEDRVAKVTWTMDDAKAAGLSGGQNYRKYPRAMLAARATGELCRDNFADVLGGLSYTHEEVSDGDLGADADAVIEFRDDVAPPEKATSTRKAKSAPARKVARPRPPHDHGRRSRSTCPHSPVRTAMATSWTPKWSRIHRRPCGHPNPHRRADPGGPPGPWRMVEGPGHPAAQVGEHDRRAGRRHQCSDRRLQPGDPGPCCPQQEDVGDGGRGVAVRSRRGP
ncbi:MAG: hypothetical protein IPG97_19550 [Microthrixaceae bacterium]|nr:hypothetical protein [Microthrixaceae bacterium]